MASPVDDARRASKLTRLLPEALTYPQRDTVSPTWLVLGGPADSPVSDSASLLVSSEHASSLLLLAFADGPLLGTLVCSDVLHPPTVITVNNTVVRKTMLAFIILVSSPSTGSLFVNHQCAR